MPKKTGKPNDLSNTINSIKKDINAGFTELLTRVEALEASDAQHSTAWQYVIYRFKPEQLGVTNA